MTGTAAASLGSTSESPSVSVCACSGCGGARSCGNGCDGTRFCDAALDILLTATDRSGAVVGAGFTGTGCGTGDAHFAASRLRGMVGVLLGSGCAGSVTASGFVVGDDRSAVGMLSGITGASSVPDSPGPGGVGACFGACFAGGGLGGAFQTNCTFIFITYAASSARCAALMSRAHATGDPALSAAPAADRAESATCVATVATSRHWRSAIVDLWGQTRNPQCQEQVFLLPVFCGDKQEIRSVKHEPFYCQSSVGTIPFLLPVFCGGNSVSRACLSTAALALHPAKSPKMSSNPNGYGV